jgi:lysophospholipase L1-like esterase
VLVISLGALIWLILESTLYADATRLRAAAIVFVAATSVWALLQFWFEDVSSRTVAGVIGFALLAGAVGLFAGWLGTKADALPLIALACFYAGVGWILEWWRRRSGITVEGKWIFLGGVACFAAAASGAAVAAGATSLKWWLVIAAVGVVAAPVGLSLMSEAALWRLARPQPLTIPLPWGGTWQLSSRHATAAAIGAGIAIPLAAIIVETQLGHSWTPAMTAAGIALLLLVAIASDTHLDVALVICVITLLASAPPQESPPANFTSGTGTSALVALGDSYMSGEGAARFFAGTDDGGRNECRRAPTAYASLAVERADEFDALTFLACSGARTYNVIASGPGVHTDAQWDEGGTQVDQLKAIFAEHPGFKPKLVIVSLGGNDAGFATIGETCLAPGNCDTAEIQNLFTENLPAVHRALLAAYASIRSVVPGGVPIAAVPYPQPIADNDRGCEGFPLSSSERVFIADFIRQLNDVVRSAADAEGLYYVDTMPSALANAHRQLCDPLNGGKPGIYPVALESVSGLPSHRFSPAEWLHNSLHPNARGHRAMLQAFETWLGANPNLGPRNPTTQQTVPPQATDRPAPPCSFTEPGLPDCKAEARKWVARQVVDLWPWLFALVPALIGLWLLSVGGLSLRRRALIDAGKVVPPS